MQIRTHVAAHDQLLNHRYAPAAINHQAFYLKFDWNEEDAYPLLRKALEDPVIWSQEIVRNEMFRHLDYYVTESSGHNSEYNAWFRKRPDLIEKYCLPGTGWNPGVYAYFVKEYLEREQTWKADDMKKWVNEVPSLERGQEYAACSFNTIFGDGDLYQFNGNVRNFGSIDNLPDDRLEGLKNLCTMNGSANAAYPISMSVGLTPARPNAI